MGAKHPRLCLHEPARAPLRNEDLADVDGYLSHFETIAVLRSTACSLTDNEIEARKEIGRNNGSIRVKLPFFVGRVREIEFEVVR